MRHAWGKVVLRWPTAIAQRPSMTNVCQSEVLGWDGVPQGGLLSVLMLRDYTAYPSTLGAISHRLLLPSFPACQANRFSRALISGSVFAFFCVLWHPLISLIPIWHQIIDTAGLLANSGVLHSTLDLCGCVSLALPLSASLARSFLHAGLPFHEDYITAHFISHTCIHTQFNLRSSFYFQTLFRGCL